MQKKKELMNWNRKDKAMNDDEIHLVDEIIETISKDGLDVTRIILGRKIYTDFMLRRFNMYRTEDNEFIGAIPIELGYFDEDWILWTGKKTAQTSVKLTLLKLARGIENGIEQLLITE